MFCLHLVDSGGTVVYGIQKNMSPVHCCALGGKLQYLDLHNYTFVSLAFYEKFE